MKKYLETVLATIVLVFSLATSLISAPVSTGVIPSAQKSAAQRTAIKALKQTPEWAALQSDYATLTNRMALRDEDYIAATNAVAATTTTTKTALNKVINLIQADSRVDNSLKQLVQDLKRLQIDSIQAQGE